MQPHMFVNLLEDEKGHLSVEMSITKMQHGGVSEEIPWQPQGLKGVNYVNTCQTQFLIGATELNTHHYTFLQQI